MPGRKRESGHRKAGGGARDGAGDLLQLIIAYAKQETLDPVMRQLKKLGWGVAGGACMALGMALLALGFVRALQTEFGTARTPALGVLRKLNLTTPLTPVYSSAAAASRTSSASGSVHFVITPGPPEIFGTGSASPFGAGAHLSGDWSWVPYMGGVLFCLLVAGFCVLRIMKGVAR